MSWFCGHLTLAQMWLIIRKTNANCYWTLLRVITLTDPQVFVSEGHGLSEP